jgi:hypothetical protein
VKARGERMNSSSHSIIETSEQRRRKYAFDKCAEIFVKTRYEECGVCLVKNKT